MLGLELGLGLGLGLFSVVVFVFSHFRILYLPIRGTSYYRARIGKVRLHKGSIRLYTRGKGQTIDSPLFFGIVGDKQHLTARKTII